MTRGSVAWKLACRWLERRLPPDVRSELLGDLFEEFGEKLSTGRLRAQVWVLIQAWSLARSYRHGAERPEPWGASVRTVPAVVGRLARFALRGLRRQPLYALTMIVTLAIGIGGTTAVYSIFQQALLDPLPFPNAGRLAAIAETRGDSEISVSYLDFQDWQRRAQTFDALALFTGASFTVPGTDGAERVRADYIGPGLLQILGTTPALGRPFTATEEAVGGPRVALISAGLWRRHYGGDPSILTKRLQLDAESYEIVGVMPQGFDFPSGIVYSPADIYLPLGAFIAANHADVVERGSHPGLEAIGLLRQGVSIGTARAELTGIASGLRLAFPQSNRDVGVVVTDAVTAIVGDLRGQLVLVQAAVLLLLSLACTNVAGLAVTRATSMSHQRSIEVALGAPLWHVALAQAIELGIAACVGALVGIGLAAIALRFVEPLVADLPRLGSLTISWRTLGGSAALSGLSAVASALPLALRARRASMDATLRQRGGNPNLGVRRWLTVTQIALAVVLLLGAGTLARSLTRLSTDRGGLQPDGVLTFDIRLPGDWADTRTTSFFADLYERLGQLPGVTAVGGISVMPFSGGGSQSDFVRLGEAPERGVRTDVNVITPDYFRAAGIPIVRGRGLATADGPDTPAVAVVDEWFAARFWPGANPIGQHVQGWGVHDLVVVGVVGHVKNYGTSAPSREELYMALSQRPRNRLITALRSTARAAAMIPMIRQTAAGLDQSVAVANVQTMTHLVASTIAGPRTASLLSVTFAVSAVVLALVSLFGLFSYLVERRRRELAIRLTLGARPVELLMHVMAGAAGLCLVGIAVGVPSALVLVPLARSQMPYIEVPSYWQLVLEPASFLAVAMLACWVPAHRASCVPPAAVLEE